MTSEIHVKPFAVRSDNIDLSTISHRERSTPQRNSAVPIANPIQRTTSEINLLEEEASAEF
jgi:hypothetical protein